MSGAVFPLKDNQLGAANPHDNVWLSASAGTGKTQVLSARVLRLLLEPDVDPSQILCLTFTKAGAAEMANRINAVLARWVRLEDTRLFVELGNLGADQSDATRERARTLFASVLDCPGGGLRIDTIHAFSQWLLANFPEEADLLPGARPIEDRERELLAREVLAEMLTDAERDGDTALLESVKNYSRAKDPDALRGVADALRQRGRFVGRAIRLAAADARSGSCGCSTCRRMRTKPGRTRPCIPIISRTITCAPCFRSCRNGTRRVAARQPSSSRNGSGPIPTGVRRLPPVSRPRC